ncbi:hypothetical protein ACFX2J_040341 [Malus domestica]
MVSKSTHKQTRRDGNPKMMSSILNPKQPKKMARIGSSLSPKKNEELTDFLRENRDIFTWSPSDMSSIDPKVACCKLHVDLAVKLVIQKRRHLVLE